MALSRSDKRWLLAIIIVAAFVVLIDYAVIYYHG
jgi:hypothetical protein